MTRFKDFPPACSSRATAGEADPLKQPAYPTLPSPQGPSPVHDSARDSPMEPAGSEGHQSKRPVPNQATVQNQGSNGDSTNEQEPACGENCKYLCKRCDGSSYSPEGHGQGKGRYLSQEYEEHLEWRVQVMRAWWAARWKHQGCRYANAFFKHGTPPCDMGWGKALNEYVFYNGASSMKTATPEVILEWYHGRHVHEQRPESPRLKLVETGIPDHHIWEQDPPESQQQQ